MLHLSLGLYVKLLIHNLKLKGKLLWLTFLLSNKTIYTLLKSDLTCLAIVCVCVCGDVGLFEWDNCGIVIHSLWNMTLKCLEETWSLYLYTVGNLKNIFLLLKCLVPYCIEINICFSMPTVFLSPQYVYP